MTQIDVEEYAGFERRLAASLIDTIVFSLLFAILLLIVTGDAAMITMKSNGQIHFSTSRGWWEQLFYILITVSMWVKFLGTPGKLLLGCHVVDADTKQPLKIPQALIRYLGYFVSLLPLGLGFFWIIWDKRKQGFHDKLANSVVILESAHRVEDESQKTLQQLIDELK